MQVAERVPLHQEACTVHGTSEAVDQPALPPVIRRDLQFTRGIGPRTKRDVDLAVEWFHRGKTAFEPHDFGKRNVISHRKGNQRSELRLTGQTAHHDRGRRYRYHFAAVSNPGHATTRQINSSCEFFERKSRTWQ